MSDQLRQESLDSFSVLYLKSERRYDCPGISAIFYSQLGVLRSLRTATTGQQFLPHHADEKFRRH